MSTVMGMNFITGFRWPVPLAFSSAVAACRFEQGDVLYSDACAYGAWPTAAEGSGRELGHAIQVLAPTRTTRATTVEGPGKRFFSNWDSDVELEVSTRADGRRARLVTTQGRLFTCLWRGDVALLDREGDPPDPPVLQRDLHSRLEEAIPVVREKLPGGSDDCLFVWAVDESSDASRIKAHAIEEVLRARFPVERCDLTPQEAGTGEGDRFHPALVVRALRLARAGQSDVESTLKSLLYAPSAGTTTPEEPSGSEGRADRFALSRHGLLVAGTVDDSGKD
jgi:hypothetical protein